LGLRGMKFSDQRRQEDRWNVDSQPRKYGDYKLG